MLIDAKIKARNHVVGFIADDDVIRAAMSWRNLQCPEHQAELHVTDFIQRHLVTRNALGKPFKLVLSDHGLNCDLTYVTYDPHPVMRIDEALWRETKLGDPRGRYMLSHEVAHAIFHSAEAKAFSEFDEETLKAFSKQKQAEHHANLFSDYFLVPDRLVKLFREAQQISSACNVEIGVAERRVRQYTDRYLQAISTTGDNCPKCGRLLYRRGIKTFCKSMECLFEVVL